MEALFAVPLLLFNLPVYKAVPLATHFISLFPFLFMAFYFFYKQKKLQAVLVLAWVLCLPAPNDLLNSLPRGFVTGLFFTSFFIVSLFHPNNLKLLGINTALALLGYYVNPNSALVSAPFLFYLFLHHRQNKRYYWLMAGVMLLNMPLYFFFNHFYVLHPDYIINPIEYRMSASLFATNISNLDQRFTHISPFFENNSLLLLLLFGIMA
ncbi:MAG: hypothetical protein IT236_03830, partial [Bacteroidia bacterium]|nr:hypothetical protein [Bacteroidia bacterium]